MGNFSASVADHLILPARVRLTPARERALQRAGQSVPIPVPVRLLIDTGAKRTTLLPGVVRHLQPMMGGTVQVVTALRSVVTDLVWVCLEFPEAKLASFTEVLVARLPMPSMLAQFHGLLGRDLLSRLHSFEYQGRRGWYTLRDRSGWLDWLRRRL
jgi:hypothetical protein